jgi:hypothetical protein
MKKTSLVIAAAVTLLAAPAMAQSLPTLTTADSSAAQAITTTVAPACSLTSTLANPTVNLGPNAVVPGTTPIVVGTISVVCNTPNSAVAVGSNNLSNPALINTADASIFTNSVSFVARIANSSYGLDSRAGYLNGSNKWGSSAAIGFGTNNRTLQANVDIVALDSGGRLPVAGTYTGRVCVTVDPDAALNGLALNYGNDDDATCAS